MTVLDGRHAGYDHTLFVDATHLDGQGAYTLSRDVADILRHDRAGGAAGTARWVDLPAYRACPVEVALEDVEQSRQSRDQDALDGGAGRQSQGLAPPVRRRLSCPPERDRAARALGARGLR